MARPSALVTTRSDFSLDDTLDLAQIRAAYREKRRVHIPQFLHYAHAEALYEELAHESTWSIVFNANGLTYDRQENSTSEVMWLESRSACDAAYLSAREGSGYIYEHTLVAENRAQRTFEDSRLASFITWLDSEEMIECFRRLTGVSELVRVAANAKRFSAGHFGSAHHDAIAERHDSALYPRRVAFVLTLTPEWRADWGGLLQFSNSEGLVEEAYVPRFNSLSVFEVSQVHAISFVTPFASERRYTVGGFLLGQPVEPEVGMVNL
jgi:Rps23 Pro-64 3,4-dihydroxylase Tpa1-like proline 4-hydroxylase